MTTPTEPVPAPTDTTTDTPTPVTPTTTTPTTTTTTAPLLVLFGATGHTGKHMLTKALTVDNLRVRAFVRDPAKIPADLSNHPNLELFKGDLTDLDAVKTSLDGATFAASVAGGKQISANGGMHNMTKAVLQVMKEKGLTRFLYQAGCFTPVPGQKLTFKMKVLRTFFATVTGQGASLRDNDRAVEELTKKEDVQWVVTRPGRLIEGNSKGLLKESETPGATLMFEDIAAFNLDVLRSDQYNHKCIYPAYSS